MKLGMSFIASVLVNQRPEALLWLEASDFIEVAEKAYTFTREFYEQYQELPSRGQVENVVGQELPVEEGKLEFFRDEIRKRSQIFRLNGAVQSAQRDLKKRQPEEAKEVLTQFLIEEAKVHDPINSFTESLERFQVYDDQKQGKITYLSTPWPVLTGQIRGWEMPSFNVLAGITGSGKTWASCAIAEHRYEQGDEVVFVALEMPRLKILRRLDCIRYKLPFNDLVKAELTDGQEQEWVDAFKKDTKRTNKLRVFSKKTVHSVADILVLANTYLPRVVIVDGGYILEGRGSSSWEKQVSVVRDIQRAADETGVPWIVTTQMGGADEKGKKRKDAARSWNTRYAREWETDPDIVIGIGDDIDLRLAKQIEMSVIKFREIGEVRIHPFRVWLDKQMANFGEVEEVPIDQPIDVPF